MTRFVIAVLFVAAVPGWAFGQVYEKDNLPCVAEICIGDGLAELAKLKWDRAKAFFSVGEPRYADTQVLSTGEIKAVKDALRGKVVPAAAYLSLQAFDEKALPLLAGVTAACSRKELWGMYVAASENPTWVKISLLPDGGDVTTQRWTVVSIVQTFPYAGSDLQRSEIQQLLKERYAQFGHMDGRTDGTFEMNSSWQPNPENFGFSLGLFRGVDERERYKRHPACGGTKKIGID